MRNMRKNVMQILVFLVVVAVVTSQDMALCRNRCGLFVRDRECQCNRACVRFGDCCHDYHAECIEAVGTGNVGEGVSRQPITSRDISRLAHSLWSLDTNRVTGMMYSVRKQTRITHLFRHRDRSPQTLFTNVLPAALSGPTITPFRSLLDNYKRSTGVAERMTSSERQEIDVFLTAIMSTEVMQATYNLLNQKGYFSSPSEFRNYLKTTWFGLYSRSGGVLDSSAFEHAFVGEMKNGAVTGFHNWIQFYLQEMAGNLNYYGYTAQKQPNQLLVQFNWAGQVKTLSSMMVGVSPEFELALYTVCFIARPHDRCTFTLQRSPIAIRTWRISGDKLGSAYFHVA